MTKLIKYVATCVLPLVALLTTQTAFAGDANIGEAIAAPCVACHGVAGAKPIADYPIIAGQHEKYLLYALKAYKNGSRNNALMVQQVAELTKRDLENLAAYFAAQGSPLSY